MSSCIYRAKLHASSINQPAEFEGVDDDNLPRGSEDTGDAFLVGSALKVDVGALNWPSIAVRFALPSKPVLDVGSCLRIASSAYVNKKNKIKSSKFVFLQELSLR